ncbi:MAG: hypothetical protein RBR70_10795 [Arcobacter sp.]|uniref:hypothetical protein n=1 Tax=Arcobacter sp. TaxID=1872629 RepID=UPI0025900A1B|nr:hypothetical protein [Arcobacter sp.]MDD3007808.1 hypothetical protein [Arcobacter sp.]MDY3205546.1 hypothetical protein [Arcobacter sp.]
MKLLNGFGKKYFTLSSIQAHSVAPKLHSIVTSSKNYLNKKLSISSEKDEEEESPPNLQENLLSVFLENKKPCHCDCVFKRRTALVVALFKFIPRCPYYTTYFAFRRTGVHPPIF